MNDTREKTACALAVVEKKPQRPGGCVGIFFQLFDWNRRLAKKKIFSKKFLPPVRFKQSAKKFGGDEKQPKLRLIADENSGGFPPVKNNNGAGNVDNEQKREMRVPGLVARLMGLESMPALQREKSKKVPASGLVCGKGEGEKFVDNREELIVEKGGIKHELRPQKLQKTSVCERQPITRFGAEKLPFKNVLSKSRKHHTKLPSPVKSPGNLSRKRSSKLIGAATRILEPGLQTSRSKCALTYSNSFRHPPREADMEESTHSLSSQLEDHDGFGSVAAKGESSCRNCGYLLDNLNCKPTNSAQPLVFASPFSNCAGGCQGAERNKPGQSAIYQELDEELHEDDPAVAGPIIGNAQSHVKLASHKSPCGGQIQRQLGSQQGKPPKGMPVSFISDHKPHRQNQMLRARETVPPRPNLNSVTNSKLSTTTVMNRTRNFVSANQSLSCSTRPQVTARMDNGRFGMEKRITNGMNDLLPPGRKKRPANICRQGENSGFMSSTINKQSFGSHKMSGKQLGYDAHLIDHHSSRAGSLHRKDRTFNIGQGANNVVSFAFNSPVKQKTGIQEVAEIMAKSGLYCDDSLQKTASGENGRKTKFEKTCPISGDALGAILQQKLKELSCQGEDLGNAPRKTTATILQELITALTSDLPFQQDNIPPISDRRNGWCNQSHLSNPTSCTHSEANAMGMKLSVNQPVDGEYLSPGSVLEAHFSAESCPSSSVDDSLGYKMLSESQDFSYDGPQLPNPDSELWDSAVLSSTTESSKELDIGILNCVSEILCWSKVAFGLKENKLDQAKEVVLNAELVLHNATHSGSAIERASLIKHLLMDELETVASVLWMNFGCSLGIEDAREVNQLRGFALDAIIEYLGLRFQGYPNCGSKVSRKLPLHMTNNMLIPEIVEFVRRWKELSRFALDELIEREMSHSLGEWTQCETEAFETGMEISRDVFQILVDEIVTDIWNC